MATTRIANAHWEGSLIEGAGKVSLDSSGTGKFDVTWASRAEDAERPHQPGGAHRCRPLGLLQHGAVERAGRQRSRAPGARHQGRGRLRARHGHHRDPADGRARVEGLSNDEFVAAAEDAKENCPVSQALKAVDITLDAALKDSTVVAAGAVGAHRRHSAAGEPSALPDDALGERDLDALLVEAVLDPLAHLARDRPLLERGGLQHDPHDDRVGVPSLDAPDLRLLEDVAANSGSSQTSCATSLQQRADPGQVLGERDGDVERRCGPSSGSCCRRRRISPLRSTRPCR